jgi:YVTN family beta-propeller protein
MRKMFWSACLILLVASVVMAQQHSVIVLSHADHTVYELDPASGKILNKFVAKDQPHEGAVSPDGKTIYAAVPNGPHVVVIDATTFKEKKTIESEFFRSARGSASPHGSALTNDGSKLYVGLENADVPGIVVIDTKTNTVIKKIDVLLRGGHFLAIQPGTDKMYYPMREDNRVIVLDTKTDKILKIIPIEGGPVGVGFAPNGEVWIHNDRDGGVHVIDSKTDTVVKSFPYTGFGAGRMAVSRDGKWAASTHSASQDVTIINAATKQVAATLNIGGGPGFSMFSPDSSKLYIMISSLDEVCVIDLKTMAIAGRHKVGDGPFGGDLRFIGGRPSSN